MIAIGIAAGCLLTLGLALVTTGVVMEAAGYHPQMPAPTHAAPAPTPKPAPKPAPAPTPAPASPSASVPAPKPVPAPVTPPADRAGAAAILAKSVAHYRAMFQQGQDIIGHTQYADGFAGLAAMDDPTSAAARFRDYRQNPGPERDLSSDDAFSRADAKFTAANEPQAISDWRDDMGTAQGDLSQWVLVAVDYQISQKSQADLDAAASKVEQDLTKADADVRAVAGN